jgi:hypothetical protein
MGVEAEMIHPVARQAMVISMGLVVAVAAACGGSESPAPQGRGTKPGGNLTAGIEILASGSAERSATAGRPEGETNNVVTIIHHDWGGAIFELHIFEDPMAAQQAKAPDDVPPSHGIDFRQFQWQTDGPTTLTFQCSRRDAVAFDLTGRVEVRGNQVVCVGKVTNRGTERWSRQTGLGWMGLWARQAPEFHDATGDRTTIYRTGSPAPATIAEMMGDRQPNYIILLIEQLYREQISVSNPAGTRRVTIQTQPCNSLSGCRAPSIASIDANIDLDLPAGGSSEFIAAVTFEDYKAQR